MHGAILLTREKNDHFHQKTYRLEAMWLLHPQCKDIIKKAWDILVEGPRAYKLLAKLKDTMNSLKRWNREVVGSLQNRKKDLEARLQEAQNSIHTLEDAKKEREIMKELEMVLQQEKIVWWQKSRVEWIVKVYRNIKFYHAVINGGTRHGRNPEITQHAKAYSKTQGNHGKAFLCRGSGTSHFSIGGLQGTKPDGEPMIFFRHNSEIVKGNPKPCLVDRRMASGL
ncbi:hypothetical protein COLO4_07462 [Corchorus olitorius]|uniref:Uncharacterized protein n=1 Tax=Corchorus olitorius TaxID=93759 RepID=A0A1R3KJR1_9ROSI|nr:hypothetical protein COLO4_07462 [Corchorus olitorius]